MFLAFERILANEIVLKQVSHRRPTRLVDEIELVSIRSDILEGY